MKKLILLSSVNLLLSGTVSFAQVTIATNFSPPGTQFVGWDGTGIAKPLDIRNDFAGQPIDFFTNSARRMRILDGGNGSAAGRIALGNNLPAGFTPLARLHLAQFGGLLNSQMFRSDGSAGTDHRWNMWTGATPASVTERFRITTLAGGSNVNIDNIETATGTGGETQLQLRQAEFNIFARNKRLGQFTEIAGAIPDEVVFGDGTSVNTSALSSNNRGFKLFGNSGNYRLGDFFVIHPAANIQLDVIARDLPQITTDPFDIGDVFFQGRIATDTLSFIRLQNGITNDALMVPAVTGHNNGNQFQGIAVVGRINPNFDLAGNTTAVMEFDARASDPAAGNNAQVINNRLLFNWCNFTQNNMSMTAIGRLGLRTINPGNRLEIVGQNTDPYFGSVNGQSGLRLKNMTSLNAPMATNPGTGVLAVDANGDVIYVEGGGSTFGSFCSQVSVPLFDDYEIALNTHNVYFTGQGTPTSNSVGLGFICGAGLPAKLSVLQGTGTPVTVNTIAGGFQNGDVTSLSAQTFRGVSGLADGVQPVSSISNILNIGGDFAGRNANINIGVRGRANAMIQYDNLAIGGDFLADGPSVSNFGVRAVGSGSTNENFGIRSSAFNTSPSTSTNYGGRFTATGGTLNFGIYADVGGVIDPIPGSLPPASGSFAGYFNGSVIRTGNDNFSSDAALKTNIDTIENASAIIEQLKPRTFFYDTTNAHGMVFGSNRQYGFIAQDVETVLPELVGSATQPAAYDTLGNIVVPTYTYKTLQYQPFIALLTKGIQEQKSENDSLKEVVNNLNERLNAQDSINNALYAMITQCCQSNNGNQNMMQNSNNSNGIGINVTSVELSDVKTVILDQNVPNPFAEQTTITFTLTEGVQKAQMLFYNLEGKLIQSADLSNKAGQGQLNVFANDLSNGIYTYTLVVDGKIIDTKKMIKQK